MTIATTLALPLTVAGNGALTALVQGTAAEIGQAVGLLLDTRPGERLAVPGYGLPDPRGSGLQPDVVTDVVTDWEERALSVDTEVLRAVVNQDATVRADTSGTL